MDIATLLGLMGCRDCSNNTDLIISFVDNGTTVVIIEFVLELLLFLAAKNMACDNVIPSRPNREIL